MTAATSAEQLEYLERWVEWARECIELLAHEVGRHIVAVELPEFPPKQPT